MKPISACLAHPLLAACSGVIFSAALRLAALLLLEAPQNTTAVGLILPQGLVVHKAGAKLEKTAKGSAVDDVFHAVDSLGEMLDC